MNLKSKQYYEATKNVKPHHNLQHFLEMNIKPGTAIDLGCGAGRDTVFLLQHHWKVTSIDKEYTENYILSQLLSKQIDNFHFEQQDFSNIVLDRTDLVVANYSLPFSGNQYFYPLWNKIVHSIKSNGYFVGNFLGERDSWNKVKDDMIFLTKDSVLDLFNEFNIIDFKEIEKDSKTATGFFKHWHIYEVIAKKNKR